ncbi:MAG: DUF1553 domain-containing protein [Planctomycetota bacterium]|nr:DUF1553 domain-containing protein [Planctomycetota bacterium]
MYPILRAILLCLSATVCVLTAGFAAESGNRKIDFSRDIRPILSDRCFRCHGPDAAERKADLRLDQRESATSLLPSGATAIVPGDRSASELVRRILSEDDAERMPPAEMKKPLTAEEKEKLARWITEGAEYRQHWSFLAARRPQPPPDPFSNWARNPIDHFVADQMHREGLQPTPEASRETLIRRLTLDLTGLPPTLTEIDAFLTDQSDQAYEHLVDRLLASPHYGERMALDWLDASRFADTNGYHLDNGRDMTRWRAWVIRAYNDNLPFDDFTVYQIAGDLLPFATLDQQVASGFNRNHMINFEGGAIPEEYLNAYIVDRVNTTGAVWLGLTIGCAQCHDHKYDPISQREFYQLYAYFNNVPEEGLDGRSGNSEPKLALPTSEQTIRQSELNLQLSQASAEKTKLEIELGKQQPAWEQEAVAQLSSQASPTVPEEIRVILTKSESDRSDEERAQLADNFRRQDANWVALVARLDQINQDSNALQSSIPTTMVMREMDTPRETHVLTRGKYDAHGEQVTAAVPASFHPFPSTAPSNRLGLARWLVSPDNPLTARVIVNRYWQTIFGLGLVKTAEDFGSQGESPSHPELLDWLACEFQQATLAPVAGSGREAWNIKGLMRLIVTSSTYRQSAQAPPERYAHDPENRFLARGARYRLPAEFVRDQALSLSGLIKHNIGGPSVSPYQPGELWGELSSRQDSNNWTAQSFTLSEGDDLYRRSMYTFWKRTSPPPQLSTFDAPDRETCVVRRGRTNTPLQALILMNDPTYVEASRKLAERTLTEAPNDREARLSFAFRTVTGRQPQPAEFATLEKILADQLDYFHHNPASAEDLLHKNGASPTADHPAELLAAWSMVSSALLNLDEVVCRN